MFVRNFVSRTGCSKRKPQFLTPGLFLKGFQAPLSTVVEQSHLRSGVKPLLKQNLCGKSLELIWWKVIGTLHVSCFDAIWHLREVTSGVFEPWPGFHITITCNTRDGDRPLAIVNKNDRPNSFRSVSNLGRHHPFFWAQKVALCHRYHRLTKLGAASEAADCKKPIGGGCMAWINIWVVLVPASKHGHDQFQLLFFHWCEFPLPWTTYLKNAYDLPKLVLWGSQDLGLAIRIMRKTGEIYGESFRSYPIWNTRSSQMRMMLIGTPFIRVSTRTIINPQQGGETTSQAKHVQINFEFVVWFWPPTGSRLLIPVWLDTLGSPPASQPVAPCRITSFTSAWASRLLSCSLLLTSDKWAKCQAKNHWKNHWKQKTSSDLRFSRHKLSV